MSASSVCWPWRASRSIRSLRRFQEIVGAMFFAAAYFGVRCSAPLSFFCFLSARAKEKKDRVPSTALVRLGAQRTTRCKSLSGSVWDPVTEGNCVLGRGGGEQPQVNVPSVAQANSIRPAVLASLRGKGEAQRTLLSQAGMSLRRQPKGRGKPGGKHPRPTVPGRAAGGWRRKGRTIRCREQGRPAGQGTGLRGASGTGSGHTQPTGPAVRVGAVRRHERADATPVTPVPAGVRAPLDDRFTSSSPVTRSRIRQNAGEHARILANAATNEWRRTCETVI